MLTIMPNRPSSGPNGPTLMTEKGTGKALWDLRSLGLSVLAPSLAMLIVGWSF